MTTETVDRVYCSYSGADISMDVYLDHIHIWETFVPKEKLQDELDFLEKMEQEQAELKESTKESKRAKQEHLNQKWKVKPDPSNCGEQDNDS